MSSAEHLDRLRLLAEETLEVADDYWRAALEDIGYPDPSAIEALATARKLAAQVSVLCERYLPRRGAG